LAQAPFLLNASLVNALREYGDAEMAGADRV